jgi:hypothetical protein
VKNFSKAQLLQVIEILLKQIHEEQRLRMDCIGEMLNMQDSLPESDVTARIKKILESPGDII